MGCQRRAIEPHHEVLELGAGTGNLTQLLPAARRLVAVDVSNAMLAIAVRGMSCCCTCAGGYVPDTISPLAPKLPFAGFLAQLSARGFTLIDQLPGHLRPFAVETHARVALLCVQSFAVAGYYDLC